MSRNDPQLQRPPIHLRPDEPDRPQSPSRSAQPAAAAAAPARCDRRPGPCCCWSCWPSPASSSRATTSTRRCSDNLPQLDGSLTVYGLAAPVTVQRDAHGVPHIHASSLDDLVFAQGFVTAQDRLWQMDLLRRHAAGELAAILGRSMLEHDRLQRTLQLRAAADRALAALPPDQKHWLEVYARGVNASIVAQHDHLPVEFRLLGYQPAPWTPRDSMLVELAMFQDLTTGFPEKLGREALAAHLPPDLIADLYPVGSWRDHPPGQPIPDLTAPQPEIKDVPLDESQIEAARRPDAAHHCRRRTCSR